MLWLGSALRSQTQVKTEIYYIPLLDKQKDNRAPWSSWRKRNKTTGLRAWWFQEEIPSSLQNKRAFSEKYLIRLIFIFTQKPFEISGPVRYSYSFFLSLCVLSVCVCMCVWDTTPQGMVISQDPDVLEGELCGGPPWPRRDEEGASQDV